MEEQELVHKLLNGSQTIDRMRKEIDQVVKMIMSLVDNEWENNQWGEPDKHTMLNWLSIRNDLWRRDFHSPKCRWGVIGKRERHNWDWHIDCHTVEISANAMNREMIVGKWVGVISGPSVFSFRREVSQGQYGTILPSFKLENVPFVHKELATFVKGMFEGFPFLSKRLQPLLDAADYAEQNGWRF